MGLRRAAALAAVALAAGCSGHGGAAAPRAVRAQATPTARPATWASPPGSFAQPQQVRFALVSADGRRVSVTAYGGGCTADTHLFANESKDRVALRLFAYAPPPPPMTTCTTDLVVMTRSAVLAEPLGRRRLLDASTGRPVPYFDGRQLARVTWLPRDAAHPRDRLDGKHGWLRDFQFPGHRNQAPVDISQQTGSLTRADLTPGAPMAVTRTRVHGLPAVITVQRDDRGALIQAAVTWAERGWRLTVASMREWAWQRPWSPAVLMQVAEGLRLPPR